MLFNTALGPSKQLVFSNEIVEVWKDDISDHYSLYASKGFNPGDFVCEFEASAVLQTPSYLTIQVAANEHICLHPSFLQYTNHSCFPNIFFDTTDGKVVCLQPVKPGDELTYFYPSTEWEMAQPFQCHCNCNNCLGYIRGASYLSNEVLSAYRVSDFIQQQLKNEQSK